MALPTTNSPSAKRSGDELAEATIKHQERLASQRTNWESHWQEIAERVWLSGAAHFWLYHWRQAKRVHF
jgi:hypothetical protein